MHENAQGKASMDVSNSGWCILDLSSTATEQDPGAIEVLNRKFENATDRFKRITECDRCGIKCAYYVLSGTIIVFPPGCPRKNIRSSNSL